MGEEKGEGKWKSKQMAGERGSRRQEMEEERRARELGGEVG